MKNMPKRIYFEFVCTYLVLVGIIYIIVGVFSYNSILNLEYQKLYDGGKQALGYQSRYFDNQVEALYNQTIVYSADRDILKVMKWDKQTLIENVDSLEKVMETLSQDLIFNTLADEIYIFNAEKQTFISNLNIGVNGSIYYDAYLNGDAKLDNFQGFREYCEGKESNYLEILKLDNQLYLQMRVSSLEPDLHYLYRLKKESVIHEDLAGNTELFSAIELLDKDGQILYQIGAVNPEDTVFFQEDSQYLDLSCRVYLSNAYMEQQMQYVRVTISLIFMCAFFLALVVALFFSFRITEPLSAIASKLKQTNANSNMKDLFLHMNDSVKELITDNSNMNSQLLMYSENVRNVVISKILHGDSFSDHEIQFIPQEFTRLFEAASFCVAMISVCDADKADQDTSGVDKKIRANEILLNKEKNGEIFLQQITYRTYALIFFDKNDQALFYESRLQAYLAEFAHAQILVNCYVGGVYHICDELYKSYNEANQLMINFEIIKTGQYLKYADVDMSAMDFPYTIEVEQKLVSSVISNTKDVSQILESLFDKRRNMSLRDIRVLVNSVILTVRRISNKLLDIPISEINRMDLMIMNLKKSEDLTFIKDTFQFIFHILSQNVSKSNKEKNLRLVNTIDVYIKRNFTNPQLSVADISDQVDLSENYVSIFYKQMTGMNISTKIEELRMENAKKLLAETDLKVKDVSEQCGYSNLNTFYKAFKRFNGISAKEYRNLVNQ